MGSEKSGIDPYWYGLFRGTSPFVLWTPCTGDGFPQVIRTAGWTPHIRRFAFFHWLREIGARRELLL